jgi:hypothetical protein
MFELSAECKARFRRLLQFFPRYRRVGTLHEMILCHSGAVDPSRPLTNLSRVTNKISTVITEPPTPPSRLGDADHQE